MITAGMLLVAVGIGTELILQTRTPPFAAPLAARSPTDLQHLLTASQFCHHTLGKSLRLKVPGRKVSGRFCTDSLGCRSESKAVPDQNPAAFRVLVLGDDSICGPGVSDENTVTARLRTLLEKQLKVRVDVINGGVPGYCPLLSALQFEHSLAELKPNLVILHVDMTDIADDVFYRSLVKTENNVMRCSHPSLDTDRGGAQPGTLIEKLRSTVTGSWCLNRLEQYSAEHTSAVESVRCDAPLEWITDSPPDLRIQVRHALDPVRRLDEMVRRQGSQLIVTSCPVIWQLLPSGIAPELAEASRIRGATPVQSRLPFRILQSFCDQYSIRFCDSSEEFRRFQKPEKLFSRTDLTLSEYGMALYAREMARFLLNNSMAATGS